MKFILVLHKFWMESEGWEWREFEGTREEAEKEALAWRGATDKAFQDTAVCVIPIRNHETIKGPLKLTWKERITGRLASWRTEERRNYE